MALDERKKKAIAAVVAYMIEQEDAAALQEVTPQSKWGSMGRESIMQNRALVQRRGRALMMR